MVSDRQMTDGMGQIVTGQISADTIAAADIAASAVDSSEIADGAIDTAHIAADQVTFPKVAKGYEATTIDVAADANGDGVATYVFSNTFAGTPAVVASINETVDVENVNANTITATHCVIELDGCEPTSATYSLGVIAMEK